jgi:hypothetical protein
VEPLQVKRPDKKRVGAIARGRHPNESIQSPWEHRAGQGRKRSGNGNGLFGGESPEVEEAAHESVATRTGRRESNGEREQLLGERGTLARAPS